MSKNQHGLSRNIPEDIKQEIRKKYGFGCIICGLGIYEYEHIDPEFKDAREHDPTKITLLCSQCHSKKTRKFINKETIIEKMKAPINLTSGFVNEFLDINLESHIIIEIGDAKFANCNVPIRFKNQNLIKIEKPTDGSKNYILSCEFTDRTGLNTLKIINNEWITNSDSWDIIAKAGQLIIKNEDEVYLIIENKNNNTLFIKYFKTVIQGYDVEISENGLKINNAMLKLFSVSNCNIGIDCP